MKPLRLTLSGLNSFKEEQEIDFSHLCQGNVFGIFGSTGSGKSTIIDAITLALFGKVERAPSKVQGIVNKACDAASVCFDFSLAGAKEQKTYRVERKYVVNKDNSTTCRLARISEIKHDGITVLAEKISQVDAKIEEILGLTVDDFTRAVVLPQGKFAEFLSLKGTERREMLERIFNLGEFGERLIALASTEFKEVDAAIKTLQAEQAGLGEASSEALKQAQIAAAEAKRASEELQVKLEAHNRHMEQARAVVELQQGLAAAQEEKAKLDAQAQEHAALEQKLAELAKACALIDSLHLSDESEQSYSAALEKLQSAVTKLETAKAVEESRTVALEKAAAERISKEPALNALCHDLKRAAVHENKLLEYRTLEAKEVEALKAAQINLESLTRQREDYGQKEQDTTEKLALLTQEIRRCFVSPEVRVAIEQASKSEADWKHALSKQQELEVELFQRRAKLASSQKTLHEAQEKQRLAQSEYAEAMKAYTEVSSSEPAEVDNNKREQANQYRIWLEQIKALWVEHERLTGRRELVRKKSIELEMQTNELSKQLLALQSQVVAAEQEIINAETAQRLNAQASMAIELAKQLKSGEACPVCGSKEHPSPISSESSLQQDILDLKVQAARAEHTRLLRHLAAQETLKQSLDKEQAEIAVSLNEIDNELRRIQVEKDSINTLFPAEWSQLSLSELESKVAEHVQLIEEGIAVRAVWVSKYNASRQQEREKSDKLNLAKQAYALAEQHHKALAIEEAVLSEKWEKAVATTRELQDIHAQALLALNTEDLAALKASTAALDRRARELSSAQQDMEQKRSELQQVLREIESKVVMEREKATQVQSRLQTLRVQIAELTQEINAVTSGLSVEEVRLQTEAELKLLRDTEQQAQQELSLARAEVETLGQEVARSKAQLEAAAAAREKAVNALNQAMFEAGFVSRTAVVEALANRIYQGEWEKKVQSYQQKRVVVSAEIERLTKALSGRHISHEQWQLLIDKANELKSAHEQALQRQGQAQARLVDIETRHERYNELEKRKKSLNQERELLQELVSLLRGNALVEFLAAEHLQAIAGAATRWLRVLTSERYALEVDPEGSFVIRDDGNGGMRRAVHTLSGGETFVTSLALALALSAQIQLRGRYPLEFFFLDEGFGTLDPELLETVMTCLERMQGQHMSIGIISHVPELRERIQRKVLVTAAAGGKGSKLKVI